ncbi:MAG: ATP-binding protein, partial [Bacteroidota bacterium]|nr:ATP-binding protein [Bacteroidota bacterium]
MIKRLELRIILRVLLLFITLFATSFILIKGWHTYLIIIAPVIIYQLIELYRFQHKSQEEIQQFVESEHYRDFSRYFDVKHAPSELQPMREGFNQINSTFKIISKEKETQYQYLQKILELVETGILSYENESGEVMWMNESLKQMLQLPYLKTIHSLAKRDNDLYNDIVVLKPGDGKVTKAHLEKGSFKVLLSAT